MNARKISALFERLREANPHPRSELEFATPFELLVAVVLSAQATDRSVNRATVQLFRVARTPQAMLALGIEGLSRYIKSIGLYNTKARNLIAACRVLIEQHGGEVPQDRAALEALPGVGRKTANVILNVAFSEPTIAVDTHIFRVANRTGLARGPTPLAVETRLLEVVPERFRQHAHHWLILHGRYICIARRPKCPQCPIRDLCEYEEKTVSGEAARTRARGAGSGHTRALARRNSRARLS
jgi:endonuclease III